ncbi:hypothetical protein [Planctomycetes bacterium K23_9]|uniref:Uncharacterized protein n=1 Tax=Stieleria marina TaxID=1930275 RepID=A0A517P0P1_9BACT|nr:hypothetical protein K239x_49540 [Planctomycetes bacterium K23_9]
MIHFSRVAACFFVMACGLVSVALSQEAGKPTGPNKKSTAAADQIATFFEDAHDSLSSALELFDDSQKRPSENELPFYDLLSRTKESQQEKVGGYLDAAGEAMGVSSISVRRQRIRVLRETIQETQRNLTVYKRKRISAPKETYNPLITTKSGYDKKIKEGEETILLSDQKIESEKERLVKDFARIGMRLDPVEVDELLDSITGDEFVRVTIVFDNAKRFAAELERLTNESGEDLEAAKQYYGVYLMLLHSMSRLQEKFVQNVDEVYFPKLDGFIDQARQNMNEAEEAIKQGGDKQILRNNIVSNQLTYDAAILYKDGLKEQRRQMLEANVACKRNILTAENTYKTVALSKDLSDLMSVSRRAFDSITGLSIPDLRPFRNERMRDAFSEITRELRK